MVFIHHLLHSEILAICLNLFALSAFRAFLRKTNNCAKQWYKTRVSSENKRNFKANVTCS